jgi:hypothetical protein
MSQAITSVAARNRELSLLICDAAPAAKRTAPASRQLRIGNLDGTSAPDNTIFAFTYICWVAEASAEYATAA